MSIVLHAKRADGTQAECIITPVGGTIGRATTNTLVLPDPERTISRVHAQVVCRNNQYFIIDRGSNPTSLNGNPLGPENEAPLRSGDKLNIGGYEISVEVADGSTTPSLDNSTPDIVGTQPSDDNDPFADLLNEFKPTAQTSSPPSPEPPSSMSAFLSTPEGEDPLADPLAPTAVNAPVPMQDDFSFVPNRDESGLDEIFGLGAKQGGAYSDDPFAGTALGEPSSQPNTAQASDPLAALGIQPQTPVAALPDNVPGLQFAFTPPVVQSQPSVPTNQRTDPLPPAELPQAVSVELPLEPPSARVTEEDALFKAFLAGLGPSKTVPERLTPELMQRLGSLLRLATQGTIRLLHTRQEIKRELRAEMTMIAANDNNPLKFSPTVEVALGHLLGQPVRGFMDAERAMDDAFADMCAHQLGVMAGTRAALDNVFKRFSPERLETRISQNSALEKLFSTSRKAKLWDQFCLLYQELVSEAEDDFQTLFGKAFVKAYEEQMARLANEKNH